MKKYYSALVIRIFLILLLFSFSKTHSQCALAFSSVNNGSGNYTFTPQVNIPSGWMYFISWDFGDGTSWTGQQVSHQYNSTGGFLVTADIFSYDPSDSTQNCFSVAYDTVYYSGVVGGNCNLTANVGYFNTTGTTYNLYASSAGGTATYSYLSVYSSTGGFTMFPNTTNTTVTLPSSGSSQVCYYVEDSTASTYCYDSTCVIITTGSPANSCAANMILWQDSVNTMTWYGYNLTTGTAPFTYLWSFGDGTSSNQAYPSHTYSTPGTYVICLTIADANGCTSTTCDSSMAFRLSNTSNINAVSQISILNPLGINENQALNTAKIFPNPIINDAQVVFESNENSIGTLEVKNILGEKITETKIEINKGTNNKKINLSSVPSGIYFLNIYSNGKHFISQRFLK